jgi:hypothetical protein
LLLEIVAGACLNDSGFRKSLPPGFARPDFDRAQARETLRVLLQKVLENLSFNATLDRFVEDFIAACPPRLEGQMAQIAGLDRLTMDSVAGARRNVIFRLNTSENAISIDCYGRRITFPVYAQENVRFALEHETFMVRDLPGDLDEPGKLTLVRRLIREGLVLSPL